MAPIFLSAKKSSSLEQGGVCFFFSESADAPETSRAEHIITIVDEKDTLLIRKHFLHVANTTKLTFSNSQEFHACVSYMPAHMLGNDTHVKAMKNNFA